MCPASGEWGHWGPTPSLPPGYSFQAPLQKFPRPPGWLMSIWVFSWPERLNQNPVSGLGVRLGRQLSIPASIHPCLQAAVTDARRKWSDLSGHCGKPKNIPEILCPCPEEQTKWLVPNRTIGAESSVLMEIWKWAIISTFLFTTIVFSLLP